MYDSISWVTSSLTLFSLHCFVPRLASQVLLSLYCTKGDLTHPLLDMGSDCWKKADWTQWYNINCCTFREAVCLFTLTWCYIKNWPWIPGNNHVLLSIIILLFLSVVLLVHLPVCPSVCLSVRSLYHLELCLSLFGCLSISLSISLRIYLFVCLFCLDVLFFRELCIHTAVNMQVLRNNYAMWIFQSLFLQLL